MHLLRTDRIKEDIVALIDSDCYLLWDMTYLAGIAKKGSPVAHQGYMGTPLTRMHVRACAQTRAHTRECARRAVRMHAQRRHSLTALPWTARHRADSVSGQPDAPEPGLL